MVVSVFDEYEGVEERLIELANDLSQGKIAKTLSTEFGLKITKSAVATRQKKLGLEGKNSKHGPDTTEKMVEKHKERMQQQTTKRELEQLLKDKSRVELVVDSIQEAIVPFKPEKINLQLAKHPKTDEETAVLVLSDLHIGKKTPSYSSEVFVERLRELEKHIGIVVNLLRKTYPIKKLVIFGLGDFVDGDSIFPTQAWKVDQGTMNQIYQVGVPALCTFFQSMSNLFKEVKFIGVRGNHGRAGKFQSEELNFDLILYETLKLACQNLKNLEFEIPWDWYTIVEVMGRKFFLTHGSVIRMWMNLPIYGQTQKGMRWQGSIGHFDYMMLGHFHTCIHYTWNDFEVFGNGCFPTDDDFATQVLGLRSETRQLFFGVHPREGITWNYKLRLTD